MKKRANIVSNSKIKRLAALRILEYYIYRVVLSKLNKYKQIDGKYNGIIRIIDSKIFIID